MKRLRHFAIWTFAGVLGAAGLLYAGDSIYVRYRQGHPETGGAFGTVHIQPLYAVPQKSGKDDFYLGDPETDTCVHSIFPHFGYAPCWYLNRKKTETVPMTILPR